MTQKHRRCSARSRNYCAALLWCSATRAGTDSLCFPAWTPTAPAACQSSPRSATAPVETGSLSVATVGAVSSGFITSFTNFASFGNRGKDSNRALQFGQCQRWRMTLSSKSSVLWGAMISRLHRTQRIPNMNIEGRLFIVLSLCHAGPYRTTD